MKDNFLHKIKEVYQEPDIDIDVDLIWENVEHELDGNKKRRWFIFILLGFSVITISLILFSSQDSHKNHSNKSSQNNRNNIQVSHKKGFANNSVDVLKKGSESELLNVFDLGEKSNNETLVTQSDQEAYTPPFNDQKNETSHTNQNTNNSINSNTSKGDLTIIAGATSSGNSSSLLDKPESNNGSSGYSTTPYLLILNNIETLTPHTVKHNNQTFQTVKFVDTEKSKDKLERYLSFEFLSGVSIFKDQLKANSTAHEKLVLLRNSHSKSLESINFTGLISYQFDHSISLKTGLDIRQFTSRFNYDHQYLENIEQTGIDTIIITGPGSDDFIEILSTKDLTRTIHRQVQHYNQYTFINIPVLFSITLDQYKFKPEFVFGPIFNIKTSTSGLTVDENMMVVEFDNTHFKPRFGMGGFMGMNSSYNIIKHLDFTFGAQLNFYQNMKYDHQKYSQNIIGYGLNLGIIFKI